MPQTCDAIVVLALGRVAEFTDTYPTARGPMYRRIGVKQRLLFANAARTNPERFGACATAPVSNGEVNLATIASPVFTPESITQISISDPGTSSYAAGMLVTVVRSDDADAELAPCVYVRDRVIQSRNGDLNGVNALQIMYPRLPVIYTETDGGTTIELEAPYDEILVVDLTEWLVGKATAIADNIRTLALTSLKTERTDLEAAFNGHVDGYAQVVSRFRWPQKMHPDG